MKRTQNHMHDPAEEMEKGVEKIELWLRGHEAHLHDFATNLNSNEKSMEILKSLENGKNIIHQLKNVFSQTTASRGKITNKYHIPVSGSSAGIKETQMHIINEKSIFFHDHAIKKEAKSPLFPSRRYIKK